MQIMADRRPIRPACLLARAGILALVGWLAAAVFVLPAAAEPAARPPISPVQMEKLLRVIDERGQNMRLDDRIADALGLGQDVIVRQATATDPVDHQSYFFATIPSAGRYLVGTRDLLGNDIFLFDPDLRLIAGVSTRNNVQKIPLPEAGKKANDLLAKFAAFLEMN